MNDISRAAVGVFQHWVSAANTPKTAVTVANGTGTSTAADVLAALEAQLQAGEKTRAALKQAAQVLPNNKDIRLARGEYNAVRRVAEQAVKVLRSQVQARQVVNPRIIATAEQTVARCVQLEGRLAQLAVQSLSKANLATVSRGYALFEAEAPALARAAVPALGNWAKVAACGARLAPFIAVAVFVGVAGYAAYESQYAQERA